MCCRADTTRCAIFYQFFFSKVMGEWPWRYKTRSKVIMHDTPSHASDHLYLIWKESIQNCRSYRADTTCRTDGRTDRWSETNMPPTNNFVVGGWVGVGGGGGGCVSGCGVWGCGGVVCVGGGGGGGGWGGGGVGGGGGVKIILQNTLKWLPHLPCQWWQCT